MGRYECRRGSADVVAWSDPPNDATCSRGRTAGADSDADVLEFIPAYIDAFAKAKAESKNADELIAKMKAKYPDLGRVDALEQAATQAFAPPAPPAAAPAATPK